MVISQVHGDMFDRDYDVEANNDATAIEIAKGLFSEDYETDPDKVEALYIEWPKGTIKKAYTVFGSVRDPYDGSNNSFDYDLEAETERAAISLAKGNYAHDHEVSPSIVGITKIQCESIEERDARLAKEYKEKTEREKERLKHEAELDKTDVGRIIQKMDVENQTKMLLDYYKNNPPTGLKEYVIKEFEELKRWFSESVRRNIDDLRDDYVFDLELLTNNDGRTGKGKFDRAYCRSLMSGINKLENFIHGDFLTKFLVSKFHLDPLCGNPYKGDMVKDLYSKLNEWNDPEIKNIIDCVGDKTTKISIDMVYKLKYCKEGFLGSKSYSLFTYTLNIEPHLLNLLKLLINFNERHLAIMYSYNAPSLSDSRKLADTYLSIELPIDLNNPSTFRGEHRVSLPGNLSGGICFSSTFLRGGNVVLAVVRNRY